MIHPHPSKATIIVPKTESSTAVRGGMGPSVWSTACLMTTACTGITRVMNVTEGKCAGMAGKGQAALIENRTELVVSRA